MKPIKGLFVTGQQMKFTNTPQVDAEGQQVVQEYNLRAGANAGAPGQAGASLGSIPAVVQYHAGNAGQAAQAARTSCQACKHFDVKAWQEFLVKATGAAATEEWKKTIHTMRSRIMMAGYGYAGDNSNEEDGVEKTLWNHGICRVLSDWVESQAGRDPSWWPVVPWREATCPTYCRAGAGKPELQVVTAQQPYGFFQPKDVDAEKAGAIRYDAILHAAQGR